MWTLHKSRAGKTLAVGGVFLAGSLASCSFATRPQPMRQFFLPPARAMAAQPEPILDPPSPLTALFANEAPMVNDSHTPLARPTDAEFIIKKADDRFVEGKKALEAGKPDDARREFDKAIETLLAAPETLSDRARVEKRLEELIETIYRYDADQSASGEESDKVVYDKSPMEAILEMTFPVDPSMRSKVKEMIQSTASQLPLQQHDSVVGAVNFFSSERGKKILASGLRRQAKYKPMIDKILTEEGLPLELIFLAQQESSFLPRAMSNKLCVGMWQFSKYTGAEYGLTQTPATDDRMDPEKATRAAARHLRDLYDHFGDWYLAMAAYDCGPACVDKAVMRTGYADFFELRRLNVLPKETANYVPVILGMTIVAKNAKTYGLDQIDVESPLEYDSVELQTPTHLALIADAVDRPLSELKELNPGLIRLVAPAGLRIHVPKGSISQVETAFSVVPANKRDAWRLHRVSDGDTFAGLAKRYNTQTASISLANHETIPDRGAWMPIPIAYPGDRTPVKSVKTVSKRRPVASARTKSVPKGPVRHTASARTPNSA